MRISVQVKTNARKDQVQVRQDGSLLVLVNVPPVEGRANRRLIEILAGHFRKPKSAIRIVAGKKSKHKVVELME